MSYAPLWCKSTYSFLEGASHPDELVEEAHRLGIPSIALTDRDGVPASCARTSAPRNRRKLIIGAEITLFDESSLGARDGSKRVREPVPFISKGGCVRPKA